MGRVFYDEISKMEELSTGLSAEALTRSRWGKSIEIISLPNPSQKSTIVWYHNPEYGVPVASSVTLQEMRNSGLSPKDFGVV